MKKNKELTVKRFIEILKMARDIDIAPIEFWIGEKEYELDSVGQFGILANVTVTLKKAANSPIMQPAILQKSMRKKAAKILKKIKSKK